VNVTVKIDVGRICLQEKKRQTQVSLYISRHFIFSALSGHVINRSQVMSPPYRLHSLRLQYTSYINVLVRLSFVLQPRYFYGEYIVSVTYVILRYASLYRMYIIQMCGTCTGTARLFSCILRRLLSSNTFRFLQPSNYL